jgi:hypothetical protein
MLSQVLPEPVILASSVLPSGLDSGLDDKKPILRLHDSAKKSSHLGRLELRNYRPSRLRDPGPGTERLDDRYKVVVVSGLPSLRSYVTM